MQQIVRIATDAQGAQVVSARELYEFLGIKSKFADWIKNRISKYGLAENQDFVSVSKILENGGREIDYALTLDTAKELAMVEGNDKGKQARQYFIECEKQLREAAKPMSTLDFLQVTLNQMKQQEQRLEAVESKMLEIEAKTTTRPEYFTIMGFAILKGAKVGLSMAAQLGRKAKTLCNQRGYQVEKIADPRFGQVGCYPRDVLEEIFA